MTAVPGRPVRVAVDVRGWTRETRGIGLYVKHILVRWVGSSGVDLSLIKARMEDVSGLNVAAPYISLSFSRTLIQRVPSLAEPLDDIGRTHDAVFLPNMAVYPSSHRVPVVVTAHDVTAIENTDFFRTRDRLWHWLVDFRGLMRRATLVLANSRQTETELLHAGVPPERIRVIYLGIGDEFRRAGPEDIARVRALLGLRDRPYFLYVGAVETRKNVSALIRGYRRARANGLDAALVIAGPVREPDELRDADDDVKVLGWIESSDKVALYSGAVAAVSLAKHEGLGLAPLEAFSCETTSILSALPVYQETIASNATYVESDEPDIVAAALIAQRSSPAAVDTGELERLRVKFSWDTCAADSLDAIVGVTRERQ